MAFSARPFQPSGPRRAFCFETGNQFRDREPIRDGEPFGTGNHFGTGNQGAAGAHFGTGNQVYDSVGAVTCDQFRRPPRIERNYTTPSVGGNGNQKATGTKRQREPKGNANQKATGTKFWGKGTIPFPLHQPPFSSPCFLGCLKSALVVTPKAICSAQRLTYPTRG